MSERDTPFRSELEQVIFEPKRKLVHEARSPNNPIREKLAPHGLRLLSLQLKGKLPPDLVLADDLKKTVSTGSRTFVDVTLNTSQISMSLRPGLSIDVTLFGVASLDEFTWVFGEREPRIVLRDVGSGIDPSSLILDQVKKDFGEAFRSSVFAKSGYDWTRDPRLFDSVTQFYQSVSNPLEPRGQFVAQLLLDTLTVTAMPLGQQRFGDEKTFASLEENSSIVVTVNFQAFLGDLIDGAKASRQALANTVILNSVTVQCSLRLFYEGQEIGRIQSLEISRDGRVFIREFAIVHRTAAAVENTINAGAVTLAFLWNLLGESFKLAPLVTGQAGSAALGLTGDAANRALRESLGTAVAGASEAKLDIVVGEIRRTLEPMLTEKLRQLLRENLRAIPGVDLTAAFDLPRELK